ncbi:hypothetical protein NHX12_024037 [Muraenolepis orangiensis]|uniref:Uncharacterized protein n=1 Tax=Muraenolepis orangiensis TaxID=630683 RepID=A0A9Q0EM63_9TELE|nr:hypothetical protein NHX12_024037 [Muraenolepis orangiensis]
MGAIHLTFQYRPDTGDYGGSVGPAARIVHQIHVGRVHGERLADTMQADRQDRTQTRNSHADLSPPRT